MTDSQQDFVGRHYSTRAQAYVLSVDHSAGDDLEQIESMLQGAAMARVLDLGCGGGHISYRAAPHVAQVVACDLTPSMLSIVQKEARSRGIANITVQQAAAEALPFEDDGFDAVLCRFTAHHWQNLEAGLREARRVLKPAGQAIFIDVTAPADPVLDTHLQAVELLRDAAHVRDYTSAEWVAALARSGFSLRGVTARKLRLQFSTWIARTDTPPSHAGAIRSLQQHSPPAVQRYFALAQDGSFDLDTTTFVTKPA